MFRSIRNILRERTLSLAKVTLLYKSSVTIHCYKLCSVVAACVSGCGVCTGCCAAWDCTLHSTQCTHHMLPHHSITYNDVFLLIISTEV